MLNLICNRVKCIMNLNDDKLQGENLLGWFDLVSIFLFVF